MRPHGGIGATGRCALLAALSLAMGSSGCGDPGSTLEIRPRGSLTDSTSLAGIELEFDGRRVTAADFGPDETGLVTVELDVPNSGQLLIRVQLWESGRLVAEGDAGMTMASEHEWGVDIFRTATDPTETCFGCSGSASFPVAEWAAREAGEAVWVVWGGQPRGSDIVY